MTGDGSADTIGQVEIAVHDDVAVFLGGVEDRSPNGVETFEFVAPETGPSYIAALGEDDNFTGRYSCARDLGYRLAADGHPHDCAQIPSPPGPILDCLGLDHLRKLLRTDPVEAAKPGRAIPKIVPVV